jgi:hypothetical protein
MSEITYHIGDATFPIGTGIKLLPHVVNDAGGWGAGYVLALSKRWKTPERRYREWFAKKVNIHHIDFKLGMVEYVHVEPDIIVVNMIAQKGYSSDDGIPLQYDALRHCLDNGIGYLDDGFSVHMPRIGCGLAGGKWGLVEPIIQETLIARGIPVHVYDLK